MTLSSSLPSSFALPVSNERTLTVETFHPGFRTVAQFETIRAIVARPDFDFSCGDAIFTPDGTCRGYRGPFCFTYYTKDGALHADRIYASGKVKLAVTVKNGVTSSVPAVR